MSKYVFVTVVHHHDAQLLRQYTDLLRTRGSEGFITIDTTLPGNPCCPRSRFRGTNRSRTVTNITLDHIKAARLVMGHLAELGHRDIAVIKGQPLSVDSGRAL